jgi:hypothetical protein
MQTSKVVKISSQIYIGFCVLSLLYVSLLSLYSPQATMNLVSTPLPNTDALSSIRGVYGEVGMVICMTLVFLIFSNVAQALGFLSAFWLFYAFSRLLTIWLDGPLGQFGSNWLMMESVLGLMALLLSVLMSKFKP